MKPPKTRKEILQRSQSVGGLDLPNRRYYDWLAHAQKTVYWPSSLKVVKGPEVRLEPVAAAVWTKLTCYVL